ncbi:hypothetical protein SD81_024240 [Tolypothrix campylonemoides VB511288]|nr:hypothetical protein SD81_024240 [Tolypothrix campylonemoides VB511288]
MPSATSGRYQSRLFKFFHQQSRRWGEQFDRTKRHLQVAASWSLEALLYPVYLLIQKGTASVGKQLHTNEQQPKLYLPTNETDSQPESPPSSDTPIQRVLEAVEMQARDIEKRFLMERWGDGEVGRISNKTPPITSFPHHPIAETSIPPSPYCPPLAPNFGGNFKAFHHVVSSPPQVLGIASLLANRNLVLVTAENEILDILTPQQQEKLQNRIIDEVAKYWHSWRLVKVKNETKLLPEIDSLLNKLTSGSRDKVALLPQEMKTEDIDEYQYLPLPASALALLDAAFAQMESHAVVPISRVSGQLLEAVQNQLNIFVYGKHQQLTAEQELLTPDREHQTSKIQALIWGAIHYFFGRNPKKLEQTTPTNSVEQLPIGGNKKPQTALPQRPPSSALPKSPDLQSENIADPWLTMDDLFGDVQEVTVVNEQQLLVTSSQTTKSALPTSPSIKTTGEINSKFKIPNFSSSSHSPISKPETHSNKAESVYQQRKTTQVEAPDWIETQAQTVGYEKHPLEQILEWLDRAMLWLEDIFVKIGLFLRGLLRGK